MGRLTEAFKNFTKTDLTSMEGRVLLPHSFITQAAPDIRRKLQKLGKGPGTPISDLVEEANREQGGGSKKGAKRNLKRQENREADPGLSPTTG